MSETFSTKVSEQMVARDSGRCVRCGGRGTERHHRRRRRIDHDGLAHSTANGIRLCGWGNHTGCHGAVHSNPTAAKVKGYIVGPDEDPREVPMWHYSRGWVLLDADGGWTATQEPRPQTGVDGEGDDA